MTAFNNPTKMVVKCERCGEKEEIISPHGSLKTKGKNKRRYCTSCQQRKKVEDAKARRDKQKNARKGR